jgi:hypothetical protein
VSACLDDGTDVRSSRHSLNDYASSRAIVCAFPGTMLRGERSIERIAKFRQEQSEVAKEGVTAVDDPGQDGGMPFDGQSINDEARAEQS